MPHNKQARAIRPCLSPQESDGGTYEETVQATPSDSRSTHHSKWQYKTEKEYLCIRGDEERGFTAAEFLQAQDEGWEKQYPYLVGKKKVYMTTADGEAQGLKRASKHPKSTTYGRQNPVTERWNSESQLILWRSAWADIFNDALHGGCMKYLRADLNEKYQRLADAFISVL